MGKHSFCKFASTCSIYQEKEDKTGTDLVIYKNVFCHRGIQGWSNCSLYLKLTNEDNASPNEPEATVK